MIETVALQEIPDPTQEEDPLKVLEDPPPPRAMTEMCFISETWAAELKKTKSVKPLKNVVKSAVLNLLKTLTPMNAVVLLSSPSILVMMQLKASDSTTLNLMAERSVSKSQREFVDIKRLLVNILDTTNPVEVVVAAEEAPLLVTEEDLPEAAEEIQEIDTQIEETEIETAEETDIVQDQEKDIIDHLVTEAIPDPEEEDKSRSIFILSRQRQLNKQTIIIV